nr:transcription factor VOZ1-like isoform X1 [Tanacetum cinerariifolium]
MTNGNSLKMLSGYLVFITLWSNGLWHVSLLQPITFVSVVKDMATSKGQMIREDASFKYHFGCRSLKITNLCFADDLLVMCHGDLNSVKVIKKALDNFSNVFGLHPILGKSTIVCGSMDKVAIENILTILPFKIGKLPVRYLGVPLMAKKIEAAVFKLPKAICKDIKIIFKGFLWNQGDLQKADKKDSLWVRWINVVRLKGRSVWEIEKQSNDSWMWKSLLDMREATRKHMQYKVGNESLADCVNDNGWKWAKDWFTRYPILNKYSVPVFNAADEDKMMWCSINRRTREFSSSQAWKDFRTSNEEMKWWKVIWFSQNVPRQAFVLWMASKGKLVTQDKLSKWYPGHNRKCSLCLQVEDSHKHLFFECEYSKIVWEKMQMMANVENLKNLDECMTKLSSLPCKNSIWSIVRRLCIADTVYHLWLERNARLFQQKERSTNSIIQHILDSVCSKLVTLKKREKAQSSISVSIEGKRKGHSLFPLGRASKRLHHVKLQLMKKLGLGKSYDWYSPSMKDLQQHSVIQAKMGKDTEYRKLKETAKIRVDDLQDKLTRLQYAANESAGGGGIDVAVLQQEVSEILKDWNNELNQPSPASSLQQQGSSLGFSSLERLLQPLDEEDDATSGLTPQKADLGAHETAGQSASLYEDLIGQYNVDSSGVATVGAHSTTANTTGLDNFCFDVPQDFGLDDSIGLDFLDFNQVEENLPEITVPPPPSAFLGPKCALWDCPRPAQGGWCTDYCSSLHAGNAQTEGMSGMIPVVRPKGIDLNDNLLIAALSAKTQGKSVGVPECEGAATTKSPWNAPELFDISILELKVVDGKKGSKKKIDNDSLTELQKQMSQLTAKSSVDSGNKTSGKGRVTNLDVSPYSSLLFESLFYLWLLKRELMQGNIYPILLSAPMQVNAPYNPSSEIAAGRTP